MPEGGAMSRDARSDLRIFVWAITAYLWGAALILALLAGLVYRPLGDWAFDLFLIFSEWAWE